MTRYSSSIAPPSLVVMLQRLKPLAIWLSSFSSSESDGFSALTRSPASWRTVNWSKGRLRLKAPTTHCR